MLRVKNIRREVVMGIVGDGINKRKGLQTKRRRLILSCGHFTNWKQISTPVPFLTICYSCTGDREKLIKQHNDQMGNGKYYMNRRKVKPFVTGYGQWRYSFQELKAAIASDLKHPGKV